MTIWFEGSKNIACTVQQVTRSFENPGEHFVGVVNHMPGMTSVELVDQGDHFVTIKTNEGLMKRTGISIDGTKDKLVVEFDEEYQAGKMVTGTSHFLHSFEQIESGISHRLVISDVKAPGFLGFLYRTFGSSRMGNAFLHAYATYLEGDAPMK